jgi:protein SCO1/2
MRFAIVFVLAAALVTSCARRPDDHRYPLHGQVVTVEPSRKLVMVKHDDMKGFMPAMTMPYEVQNANALDGLSPGDLIDATLVVFSNGAYLTGIKKSGTAPLERAAEAAAPPPASPRVELLRPGDPVPNARFIDQNGKKRQFGDLKGSPVVMTFIYTKCPLPTFCPLMDRHFASMQQPLKADPALASVHLVTVSFDPVTDTPAVLNAHARTLGADPSRWTFLTGDRDEIDRFSARFGMSVSRAPNDPRDITHNLRTAIIDAEGKLVKVYTGNEWTPEEVIRDLGSVIRRGRES